MKRTIILLTILLTTTCIRAQMLTPQVLSTTGAYSAVGGYSLSYTVGEMAAIETFTASGGSTILTQGFEQPQDVLIGLLEISRDVNGTFIVYPNPATDHLWFGYEFDERGEVAVSLYDVTGRKLDYTYSESYESGKAVHSFDCTAYASGNYVLVAKFTTHSGLVNQLSRKFQIIN